MPKKKVLKPILISVGCLVPVGLIVGLSVNWSGTQFISSVGSSGVKPFVEAFGSTYHKEHKKIDVAIESGGTAFGINQVARGLSNLGNVSNNPFEQAQPYDWTNMKTFTLGWEGVVIMYKMPDGLTENGQKYFDLEINQENIKYLYAAFSCFDEIKGGTFEKDKTSMYEFLTDAARNEINKSSQDMIACKETQIIPYVRAGGNSGASSSIAFSKMSHLMEWDDLTDNQKNAFAGGQYGKARKHFETDESNARAWEMFEDNDLPGSMTYMTSSFVVNEHNQQMMQEHGYKLAKYVPKYDDKKPTPVEFSLNAICDDNGYNWFRPIDIIINLNDQKAKDFIYWIYFDAEPDDKVDISESLPESFISTVESKGAKAVTTFEQLASSCDMNKDNWYDALFEQDDTELEQWTQGYCGAKEFI